MVIASGSPNRWVVILQQCVTPLWPKLPSTSTQNPVDVLSNHVIRDYFTPGIQKKMQLHAFNYQARSAGTSGFWVAGVPVTSNLTLVEVKDWSVFIKSVIHIPFTSLSFRVHHYYLHHIPTINRPFIHTKPRDGITNVMVHQSFAYQPHNCLALIQRWTLWQNPQRPSPLMVGSMETYSDLSVTVSRVGSS